MSVIRIRQGVLAQLQEEVLPLIAAQWREVAHFQDEIPLDVLWERYLESERLGLYFVLIARRGDELVGYSSFYFIERPDHYASSPLAASDVIYVEPALRKAGLGTGLIAATERLAKQKGAKWITWHVKPELDFGPFLTERLGYILHEKSYAKVL